MFISDDIADTVDTSRTHVYERSDNEIDYANYLPLLPDSSDIVYTFKGTDHWFDILTDLDISLNYSGIDLFGFNQAATAHATSIRDQLADPAGITISLTGHSLGGLMALEVFAHLIDMVPTTHLDRITRIDTFQTFAIATWGYEKLHTIARTSSHPAYDVVRAKIYSHIVNSDFASQLLRSQQGGFANIVIYPDKTPNVISSLVGVSRESYLNYDNHALDSFTAVAPTDIHVALEADSVGTIMSEKAGDLSAHPGGTTAMQLSVFNPTAIIAPPTDKVYLSVPELITLHEDFINWNINRMDKSAYRAGPLDTIAFPYSVTNSGTNAAAQQTNYVFYFHPVSGTLNANCWHIEVYTTTAQRLGFLVVPSGQFSTFDLRSGFIQASLVHNISTYVQPDAILRTQWSLQQPVDFSGWAEEDLRRDLGFSYRSIHLRRPQHGRFYKIRHAYLNGRVLGIYRLSSPAAFTDEGQLVLTYDDNAYESSGATTNKVFQCFYNLDSDTYSFLDIQYSQDNSTGSIVNSAHEVYIGESNVHEHNWVATTQDNNIEFQLLDNTPENLTQQHAGSTFAITFDEYFLLKNTGNNYYVFVNDSWAESDPTASDYRGSIDPITYMSGYTPDWWGLFKFEEVLYP